MHYDENPSWQAVKPLQNVILHTHITPEKVEASNAAASASSAKSTAASSTTTTKVSIPPIKVPQSPRPIHITTLQIPMLYDAVLEKVPPLFSRPSVLPDDSPPDCLPPPPNGFDFVFHIGVAGRGPLRMERLGHKLGYHMKDASGKYAPVVKVVPKDFSRREQGDNNGPGGMSAGSPFVINGTLVNPAEIMEKIGIDVVDVSGVGGSTGDMIARPTRGFGIGYETLQDEYTTDIDVTRLVSDMKKQGVEACLIYCRLKSDLIFFPLTFSKFILRWTQATTLPTSCTTAPLPRLHALSNHMKRSVELPKYSFCIVLLQVSPFRRKRLRMQLRRSSSGCVGRSCYSLYETRLQLLRVSLLMHNHLRPVLIRKLTSP